MTEWKKYTASPGQIDEITSAENGLIAKNEHGVESKIIPPFLHRTDGKFEIQHDENIFSLHVITEYLICNPHPLEDMICQQARTGQPVYVKTP